MYQISNESGKTCPNCAETIRPNAILCRFCKTGLSKDYFRSCPYCAESIRKEATLCRFCHSKLRYSSESASGIAESGHKKSAKQISFGAGVRSQVFEVIVRQALAGAPWRQLCTLPMQINNIAEEEIEAEIAKRTKDIKDILPRTSVGDLCAIAPAGLLQTLALSGKTGTLIAERQNKEFKGFFQGGKCTHACLDKLKGVHAIFELIITWNEGCFYFKTNERLDDFDSHCELKKPLDNILLECAICEDIAKKIVDDFPAGLNSFFERAENFEELWKQISKQHLTYIDKTVVSEEDKEEMPAISMLFTGSHNTIGRAIEMMDFWSTYQVLRAIQLLIDKGLLKNTSFI